MCFLLHRLQDDEDKENISEVADIQGYPERMKNTGKLSLNTCCITVNCLTLDAVLCIAQLALVSVAYYCEFKFSVIDKLIGHDFIYCVIIQAFVDNDIDIWSVIALCMKRQVSPEASTDSILLSSVSTISGRIIVRV